MDPVPPQTVPVNGSLRIFDVTLVGVNPTTGYKLLMTIGLIVIVLLLRKVLLMIGRRTLGGDIADSRRFWARQGIYVVTAIILTLGIFSIWVTPGTDISTGIGLLSAGLAFALQRVILSFAAYFVILRGDTFGVGDRITMGGVRGDVVRLGFLKTTVMEMGQPPSVADEDPAVWVNSRQYTGRLVTITNGVIFSEPVYNYSRDFPTSGRRSQCPSPTTRTGTPWNRSCCGPPAHTLWSTIRRPTKPSIGCAPSTPCPMHPSNLRSSGA